MNYNFWADIYKNDVSTGYQSYIKFPIFSDMVGFQTSVDLYMDAELIVTKGDNDDDRSTMTG